VDSRAQALLELLSVNWLSQNWGPLQAAWPKSFGSVFGKGSEETGTSRLLRLSLLDSLKEIRNAKCYEFRRQPGVGART
jgi:hypothetical protein